MDELPDLSRLNVVEKDELIRELCSWVRNLTAQATTLPTKVLELEARLAQNSRNSSQPPSSDGLGKPKPKSLRKVGEPPNGGQQGHSGHTLKQVTAPYRTETHRPPPHCAACGTCLAEPRVVETRQVFDLPKRRFEFTETTVLAGQCASSSHFKIRLNYRGFAGGLGGGSGV
jgi:transposase